MIRWPSIQRDSELLRRRIEAAQRIVRLRARLAEHFEGIGLLDGASRARRRSVEQVVLSRRQAVDGAAPSPAACSNSRRAA